ncbi:peroxidase [Ruegeria sp. HKCCD8929]|uniref:Dyp-type peroxidase n=1 Tax=Ruegeria sp. HKCCD8929 TaxID=2683006 RepID=UPI001488B8E7|nr:peroxidase [Ruegeria sp. HKCCD8929]
MTKAFNLADIQGNILRGYRRNLVRHLVLEITDRSAARRFLSASVDGNSADVPAITRDTTWRKKPPVCFNIGITFEGLRALGTPSEHLETFPTEFAQGMAKRAIKIGDFGDSAPEHWPAPFDKPERVHIIASIHADTEEPLDQVEAQVAKAFTVLGVRNGRNLPEGKVFFGYVDGISQPRFKHVIDPDQVGVDEPIDPLGTALLGYPTRQEGVLFRVPTPHELGFNGSFNAFRVLAQDVVGFETYLDQAATQLMAHPDVNQLADPDNLDRIGKGLDMHGALREVVAAQMCGRWRNGVPYELSPDAQFPDPPVSLTNFNYWHGSRCPAGSHLRRGNPRGGRIVQRIANYTRRLVRRGMSYGPDFDPQNPDDRERGLLGSFIGANIGAQFEAVMCDWINLGLHDPTITGANDPLLGANTPETSWFDMSLPDGKTIRLRGFPRLIKARGGAYTFLPSIAAIKYLSELTD